jgi:hypothetical protein
MWSISRLGWSPPLLYWRGLMEAARTKFERFGPQDLANCISAGERHQAPGRRLLGWGGMQLLVVWRSGTTLASIHE